MNTSAINESTATNDPHARFGDRGFPLLPGAIGRSTFYTGAPMPYAVRGNGCTVWDDRGRELIDANNNFTTLIHGNAHPALVEAGQRALADGACFGIPNEHEWELAETLLGRLPALDQVRFTNSGTEAVMSAFRIARAVTGRDGLIMALGGYHGTSEPALCAGGQAYLRGVPIGVIDDVTTLPVNDVEGLRAAVESAPHKYAAIIVDLLPNRAGMIPVNQEFVREARRLATEHGIVLIIDEVISLRLGPHGYAAEYDVAPDLLTAGKIIGGGLPIGAVLGTEEFMRCLDPAQSGSLAHSGTFSGNPVSMAAGSASLKLLTAEEVARLNDLGARARSAITKVIDPHGWEVRGAGSLMRPVPTGAVQVPAETQQRLWWNCYERGLLLAPGNLTSLSTPMTVAVVDDVAERLADAVVATANENAG